MILPISLAFLLQPFQGLAQPLHTADCLQDGLDMVSGTTVDLVMVARVWITAMGGAMMIGMTQTKEIGEVTGVMDGAVDTLADKRL